MEKPKTKQCKDCGQDKPIEEYYVTRHKGKGGAVTEYRYTSCKECHKERVTRNAEKRHEDSACPGTKRGGIASVTVIRAEDKEELLQQVRANVASRNQPARDNSNPVEDQMLGAHTEREQRTSAEYNKLMHGV